MRSFAVDGDQVLGACVTVCGSTSAGFLRRFKTLLSVSKEETICEVWQSTYVDSARKRLTLCIVIRAVGEDEIMMMGYIFSAG